MLRSRLVFFPSRVTDDIAQTLIPVVMGQTLGPDFMGQTLIPNVIEWTLIPNVMGQTLITYVMGQALILPAKSESSIGQILDSFQRFVFQYCKLLLICYYQLRNRNDEKIVLSNCFRSLRRLVIVFAIHLIVRDHSGFLALLYAGTVLLGILFLFDWLVLKIINFSFNHVASYFLDYIQ